METTEILAALGAVIHIGFQAGIALALLFYEKVVVKKGRGDIVALLEMGKDLLHTYFAILIPV